MMENIKSDKESITSLMLSLRPINSITKVNQLLAAIKKSGGVITKADKIMIYLNIINHDAKKLWLEKSQAELTILPSTEEEKSYSEIAKRTPAPKPARRYDVSHMTKDDKGHRMLDPNSSDYNSQLLKERLKSTFSGYSYGFSDW